MKLLFSNNFPNFVTVHYDGKLLPGLKRTESKEERLPVVVTYENDKKLIAVTVLKDGNGSSQASAVYYNALIGWNLKSIQGRQGMR